MKKSPKKLIDIVTLGAARLDTLKTQRWRSAKQLIDNDAAIMIFKLDP